MKILLFANTDWYLYNFRRALALALRDRGAEVLLVSPPGPYGPRLCALGLRWVPFAMERRSLNPLREAALLLRLAGLYRRERPDLVHHFTLKCVVYGSLAALLSGIPRRVNAVVGLGYVFASDTRRARWLRPLVRGLVRIALGGRRARVVLQNADDLAAFARTGLADAAKLRLIRGSGVDTRGFVCPEERPARPRVRVLLAARLLWDKGLGEYVAAARQLRADGAAVDFLVAGEPDPGNPASIPDDVLRGWRDEGVVQCLGHVDDMATQWANADIAVLPSYREGVPRSLLEAAASGLPIVATDVPGCREIVEHGCNGLLVPCKDPNALARAIAELSRAPAERRRMGEAGRAKVMREFDEVAVVARTLDVYRELLPDATLPMAEAAPA